MSLILRDLYRFDDFALDPSKRSLLRGGAPVVVSPKAFEVLTYLVAHPGRVITKEELLQAVWPDSFVEESNLAQHISWLRKAFGDRANYIVTVPGRGYQFTATVRTEPDGHLDAGSAVANGSRPAASPNVSAAEGAVTIPELVPTTDAPAEAGASVHPSSPVSAASSAGTIPSPPPRSRAPRLVLASALAILAVGAAYFGYHRWANARPHSVLSIAVLPFTNLTGDPAKEYLSDGVTEEIINGLARRESGKLRVIARTSSMSYKSTHQSVRDIARELGVQYVLEGSVQSQGEQIHVTARLIRADDQSDSWADTFDGDRTQILEFEDRLTDSVAQSLSINLLAGRVPEHTPANAAAHDAYLQGLYQLSQRSHIGLQNALQSFSRAVAQDPQYARAYAELAVTYNLLGQFSWMNTGEAHIQANAAALQAIAADPNLAEAHAALGFNKWFYEWNPAAAEQELQKAIQLEPTNVDARHWYALLLMTGGRADEAEQQMRAALALDPKALILRTNLGWLHYTDRQFPLAIQEMRAVLKDDPDFLTAHYKLWWTYSVTGDVPKAFQELTQVARLILTTEVQDKIATAYQSGDYPAALKVVLLSHNGDASEYFVDDARRMTFAGDKAAALQFLARALEHREGWMIFVERDPAFDPLRSEPEYANLMRELRAVSATPNDTGTRLPP